MREEGLSLENSLENPEKSSVDKKIFFAAFLALIIEGLWLLADMRIINIPGITQIVLSKDRKQIGSVEQRRHTLKRKFLDSIVWEDTTANDPLYYLDSVLTLDQSSATLRLTGDTQLTLSENTLVVLEPTTDQKTDQIRVRFSRGDIRSRNPDKKLAVDTASWTVEVEKGSEISLRTKDSENLELEVHKGKVKVKEESQATATEFEGGDVIKMHNAEVEHQKIDNTLTWVTPIKNLTLIRKYSHQFPVPVRLEWEGSATTLSWEDPLGKSQKIVLEPGAQSYELVLEKGLHHFRVGEGENTSTALPVEIWKAPEIYTFWPLPRDRFVAGRDIPFSWSEVEDISDYQLNIFNGSVSAYSKRINNRSTASEAPPIEGDYEWSVEAFDAHGFPIPYYYRSPIYFLKNPLAPPVLQEPEILDNSPPPLREPANKKKKSSSWLQLLINEAQADVGSNSGYKALFKWEVVKGADHYVIEIDDEPNFKTPLVQKNISDNEFLWSDFKLGNYYWRVAAEGKNGEKGLFSPVTTIDLTNPKVFTPPPTPQEPIHENPVAEAVVEKPSPKEPPPVKAPKLEKIKPLASEPPKTKAPKKVKEEEPEFLSQERFDDGGRPIRGYFYSTPLFESSKGSGASDITTSFTGLQFMALDSQLDFPIDANDTDVTLQLAYRSGEYKALPEQDFPFQQKIKRGNLRGTLLYGPSREIKYGLRSSTFEIIKRKGFEQVEAQDSIAYGPAFLWPIIEDLDFEGAVMFGSSAFLGEVQIRYMSGLPIIGSFNIRWGVEMEYRLVSSDVYKETQVLPKVIFGLSW